MAATLFADLKQRLGGPVNYELPLWRYGALRQSTAVNSNQSNTPPAQKRASLRDCIVSKTFTRILLLVVCILLFGDILSHSPAFSVLDNYSWTTAEQTEMDALQKAMDGDDIDWTRFAYCQYVTNPEYLCNSLMIFESLHRLKARADRIMMYPREWSLEPKDEGSEDDEEEEAQVRSLLIKARDSYAVNLVPIDIQQFGDDSTWGDSFTKLLAFNQTQYQRVLSLDSDATVLQSMDELFLLPSAPVAMPRAYWLDNGQLSSQMVLVEPSKFEFNRVVEAMRNKNESEFDMEIVNNLYAKNCLIIPHRKYDLVSGEFRSDPDTHQAYLGNNEELWDPDEIFKEAKFLHFSDWPMPKPWMAYSPLQLSSTIPPCRVDDCRDRNIWKSAYDDFKSRRERVCGTYFVHELLI